MSSARNRGLDIARGDYIGFVDGDDYIDPMMYEILLNNCENSKSDIAACSRKTVSSNGVFSKGIECKQLHILDKKTAISQLLLGKIQPSVCQVIVSKFIVKDIRFVEGKNINEDKYFLFCCMLKAERYCFQNISKYIVYLRKNSASRSKMNMRVFDIIFYSEKILKDIEKEMKELLPIAYRNDLLSKLSVIRKMCRSNDECIHYKEQYDIIRSEIINCQKRKELLIPLKYQIEIAILKFFPRLYQSFVSLYDFLILKKRGKNYV